MSKTEILAELPLLSAADRAEVQAKLDELAGRAWKDRGELSDDDKQMLDEAVASYEASPDTGSSWEEVQLACRLSCANEVARRHLAAS